MTSAIALDLRLNRSAWQRRILLGGYLLAAVAVFAAGVHWLLTAAALAALATGLWRGWRAPWPHRLRFRPGAGWHIGDSRRRALAVPGLTMAQTSRYVTSIAWGRGRGRSLALFHDAFRDTGHKRLRCLLRHGDTSAPC